MSFTFKPATRDKIGLLFAVAGASGSGKTYSALRLAKGIANGTGKIAVIDTEAGRAKHYADKFNFLHGDFEPPFTPERYVEAVRAAEEAGATVIVIDSMSHEWNGEGGLSDIAEEQARKMATGRDGKLQEWKIEAMTGPSWAKPKIRHKRMMSRLIQTRTHVIFCLRAEDKVKFQKVKDPNGYEKTQIIPVGWKPVCEKGFMFEMSGSLTLSPDRPGAVNYELDRKLNADLLKIFQDGQAITEDHGRALKLWAETGEHERPPLDKAKDGARELIERIEDATSMADVQAIAGDAQVKKQRDWLAKNRPELASQVQDALDKAADTFAPPVFTEAAE